MHIHLSLNRSVLSYLIMTMSNDNQRVTPYANCLYVFKQHPLLLHKINKFLSTGNGGCSLFCPQLNTVYKQAMLTLLILQLCNKHILSKALNTFIDAMLDMG